MEPREKFFQAIQSEFLSCYNVQIDALNVNSPTGMETIFIGLDSVKGDDKGIHIHNEFIPWSKIENLELILK